MASKVPYDLIKGGLDSTIGLTYPVVEWESIAETLNMPASSFVSLEDGFSDDRVQSVGTPSSNWMLEEGDLDIHIFVQAIDGFNVARTIAKEVQDAMRMRALSTEVRIFDVGPPNPGLIADGLWSSMIVSLGYKYYYQAPTFV